MAFESGLAAVVLLAGRLLFGGLVIYQGINHFLAPDAMAGYAEAKGVPAPKFGVVASGVMLVFGGLGVAAGVYPTVAAGAVATFLVVATPTMHDFWAVPEEQRQSEMTGFLKNLVMLGGALAFLALSNAAWAYGVGIGL